MTRAVPALLQAFCNSLLALSNSLFSLSNFTAANQMSSLLGLFSNASAKIDLAAGTSPCQDKIKTVGIACNCATIVSNRNQQPYTADYSSNNEQDTFINIPPAIWI